MANGDFQKGTWNKLPDNCTRSVTLTWFRCAEYGLVFVSKCLTWAVKTEVECIEWTWKSTKECSWWAVLFCVLWSIIVTLVCVAFGIVTSLVCTLATLVEVVVCLVWTLVSIIFCLSTAKCGTAFLLTDGSVMMQEFKSFLEGTTGLTWATNRWWKLTPDRTGSYRNGSWSRLADSRVARAGFASAVLADGRVVVCGGEYSDASGTYDQDETNTCEIYDPVANSWAPFASPTNPGSPPVVWDEIGDAPCTLLPDGTLLMGAILDPSVAKLDPVTLTWTSMARRPGVPGSGEDSWVLMPDNTIAAPSCLAAPSMWIYDIATDQWNPKTPPPQPIVAFNEIGVCPYYFFSGIRGLNLSYVKRAFVGPKYFCMARVLGGRAPFESTHGWLRTADVIAFFATLGFEAVWTSWEAPSSSALPLFPARQWGLPFFREIVFQRG